MGLGAAAETVHGLEVDKGRLTHPITLHFSGGSSYAVDLLKGSSAEELVQALGGSSGSRVAGGRAAAWRGPRCRTTTLGPCACY